MISPNRGMPSSTSLSIPQHLCTWPTRRTRIFWTQSANSTQWLHRRKSKQHQRQQLWQWHSQEWVPTLKQADLTCLWSQVRNVIQKSALGALSIQKRITIRGKMPKQCSTAKMTSRRSSRQTKDWKGIGLRRSRLMEARRQLWDLGHRQHNKILAAACQATLWKLQTAGILELT